MLKTGCNSASVQLSAPVRAGITRPSSPLYTLYPQTLRLPLGKAFSAPQNKQRNPWLQWVLEFCLYCSCLLQSIGVIFSHWNLKHYMPMHLCIPHLAIPTVEEERRERERSVGRARFTRHHKAPVRLILVLFIMH